MWDLLLEKYEDTWNQKLVSGKGNHQFSSDHNHFEDKRVRFIQK